MTTLKNPACCGEALFDGDDFTASACRIIGAAPKYSRMLGRMPKDFGEGVQLIWTSDSEFLYPGLQCRTLHSEPHGSAFWTADDPFGFSQGANNMFSLGMLQRRDAVAEGGRWNGCGKLQSPS